MRNPEEVYKAERVLRGLRAAGLELFPLGVKSKLPRDKGFLLHDYGNPDFGAWLDEWGNWGIRARACDLIMDIDPRHGGEQSLESLVWELDLDLSPYPYTITGSGGRHIFMAKPASGRWRWHLKGYPGIDFQSLGRYVVAPGSIHPETGRPYVLHGADRTGIHIPPAPAALLDRLRKPPRDTSKRASGAISPAVLAMLLKYLPAEDFGAGGEHHDEWLDIAMGAHHGTGGDGWEEWLAWCATDERYADAGEVNLNRWDSFDSERDDGVSWRTLLRAVARTGKDGARVVGKLRVRGEASAGNNATTARQDFAEFFEDADEDLPEYEEDEPAPAPGEWED